MTVKKAKSGAAGSQVKAIAPAADKVTSFAQTTVDQAQAAFEKVNELAHGNVQMMDAAANAYKNRLTDIQLKAMEFAQVNVNTGFAFVRELFSVRDGGEAILLQQDFLKAQAEILQMQVKELNDLSVALARETLKPVQDSVTKSVATLSRGISA
ncbi:phasin family protein [Aestuariivirga sp.]|jgi:hypothetical protein|uniref:phasin family protein n=1 Tax=Aestuariivirga sp. TaxID=2650926 RepID=UPI003783B7C8